MSFTPAWGSPSQSISSRGKGRPVTQPSRLLSGPILALPRKRSVISLNWSFGE